MEKRSRSCCHGKAVVLHILSVCVYVSVALVIEHAKRMRRAILSSVASLAAPCFSTLYYKWHDFRGEKNYGT
jgi:hypothetical protein